MDSIYSKFLGVGFKNNNNREYNGLQKSSSMPYLPIFEARKLPANLAGNTYYKKESGKITSSDIKVQMLEEKLRNLESRQINSVPTNQSFNKNNNTNYPIIQNYTMPIQRPLLLLNNNQNRLTRSQILKDEIISSRLKLNKYRGLQKEDYFQNLAQYSNNNINNPNYESIFMKQRYYQTLNSQNNKYKLKKYFLENQINDMKMRNNAKKFVNKLDEEIYSPLKEDFNDYMNNLNLNIQQQLKEDNIILNNDIDKIEQDYDDMKLLLSEKIQNLEYNQKANFEKLKNVIREAGGRKMSKAIQNVFEGKNYDLQKAEDEYLANDVFKLPKLINQKISEEENINKENEKRLMNEINKNMNIEYQRRRAIEEMNHRERIKMMKLQQEKEKIEYLKNINMLRYQMKKENEENYKNYINDINQYYNNLFAQKQFSINDLSKLYIMKKLNNSSGDFPFKIPNVNDANADDLLKYMLYQNLQYDNSMNNINNIMQENRNNNDMLINNNMNNSMHNNNNYNNNFPYHFNNNKINNENKNINNINNKNSLITKNSKAITSKKKNSKQNLSKSKNSKHSKLKSISRKTKEETKINEKKTENGIKETLNSNEKNKEKKKENEEEKIKEKDKEESEENSINEEKESNDEDESNKNKKNETNTKVEGNTNKEDESDEKNEENNEDKSDGKDDENDGKNEENSEDKNDDEEDKSDEKNEENNEDKNDEKDEESNNDKVDDEEDENDNENEEDNDEEEEKADE